MAIKSKADGSKLSCYHKSLIASSVFNYWTVKEKAIQIERLKSTRTPKFFDTFDGKKISDNEAKNISAKISTLANREHYNNLFHIMSGEKIFQNLEKFVGLEAEARRACIKARCSRTQTTNNSVLRILGGGGCNISASDLGKLFLISDGPRTFTFNIGYEKSKSYESEFQDLEKFLVRLKDTVALVDKVAPVLAKITDLENHSYYYNDREKIFIRFIFPSAAEPTADLILSSKMEITKGGEKTVEISPHEAAQETLTNYINSVIRRRD